MIYRCCAPKRLEKVRADGRFNGIEYLEVVDRDLGLADPLRQRTLLVHCLKTVVDLSAANVRVEGGERVRDLRAVWAASADPTPPDLSGSAEAGVRAIVEALPDRPNVLVVRVDAMGDFSTYRLVLALDPDSDAPPGDFDSQLCGIDFSFKVECPTDFDCAPVRACAGTPDDGAGIDYLARDYASLRRMMLDRLRRSVPSWETSSVADEGMALVEVLAYAGDQLSYWQDAVGTEAYLETARRRVSLRRHAVLVDYAVSDGCNARALVFVPVIGEGLTIAKRQAFLTLVPGLPTIVDPATPAWNDVKAAAPLVYEAMADVVLHASHDRIAFHTWSDERCCLPAGSTRATLKAPVVPLAVGLALLFEEVLGPETGEPGDADPAHRAIVHLTRADVGQDRLTGEAIVEIEWSADEALTFPLCLSAAQAEGDTGEALLADVSVARGNLVLVDHGATQPPESLGIVSEDGPRVLARCAGDPCAAPAIERIAARYRPTLAQGPLTQASTTPGVLAWEASSVRPSITLVSDHDVTGRPWTAQASLLDSEALDPHFVVETDETGRGTVRFGDDVNGRRPLAGEAFTATYRIGNGAAGNVGAGAIVHLVGTAGAFALVDAVADPLAVVAAGGDGVRNPLAAAGGRDAESAAQIRRNAPEAFRTQQRAVTTDDYAAVAERAPGVQRAAATLRWTGSWTTVFTTLDQDGGRRLSPAQEPTFEAYVDRFRMAGHDLEFDDPVFVPLQLSLHVCVKDGWFRSDVRRGLLDLLSNRALADGRRGLFHPDALTFGQRIYLSPVYAAAHGVPGVDSVTVTAFGRQGDDDPAPLRDGFLALGRLEIARLDNDRNFPERGVLKLDVHGGR